jgi:hypothetical protein
MFKVHESVSGPEFPVKLFARDQLTGAFEETDQDLDRLSFKPDFAALLLEFARTQVKLEDPESDQTPGWHRWSHTLRIATVQSVTPQSSGRRTGRLPAGSL